MTTRHTNLLRHALACAALVAGTSVIAVSASAEDVEQRPVHYKSTEVATDAGAQKLYNELKAASRQVCASWRMAERINEYNACYTKALSNAVSDVNEQTLTKLHDRLETKSARAHRSRSNRTAS
jgi:UrcA family protein